MFIAPSILSADFLNLEAEIDRMLPYTDYLHIDVMDGRFVPNISIGVPVVKSLKKKYQCPFDVHLMIVEPENYIKAFKDAGADLITFHVEATKDSKHVIDMIHSYNLKAGISIKPKTEVDKIKEYLPYLDLVLVMSVEPGFGGQEFLDNATFKIDELRRLKEENGYHYLIEVDGGINDKTAHLCHNADILVSGSYLFKAPNLKEAVEKIK